MTRSIKKSHSQVCKSNDADCSYHSNLESFIQRSNEDTNVVAALTDQLLKQFSKRWFDQPSFRMLDIGGGPGIKTFSLLSNLVHEARRIELVNVDPCRDWHPSYLGEARKRGLQQIAIDVCSRNWEDYEVDGLFDFVLCSHSVYGIRQLDSQTLAQSSLYKMLHVLSPGGVGCIIVQSTNNVVYKVQKKLCTIPGFEDFYVISGKTVAHWWQTLRLVPLKVQKVMKHLDVCCFYNDSPEMLEERESIMSLILAIPKGKYRLLPALVKTALEQRLLKEVAVSDTMCSEGCGSRHPHKVVPIEDDFLWFAKNP